MFTHTLDNKPIIKGKDGEDMTDLCVSIFESKSLGASTFKVLTLTERYVCRPDLISLDYYGTDEYTDLILKYNEISNPFSLVVGSLIALPEVMEITKGIKTNMVSSVVEKAEIRKESTIDTQLRKRAYKYISPKNIEEINETPNINRPFNELTIPASGKRVAPPNVAKAGESPIISRNGRYILEGNHECCVTENPNITDVMKGR